METMNISVTPLQLVLTLAFQIWIVVFPILIIKKLNYLTELLQAQFEVDQDPS